MDAWRTSSVSPCNPPGRAEPVRILITGVSGYAGAALVPRLRAGGHELRGFARSRERVASAGVRLDDLVLGDAVTGAGLDRALDGVDVAYYLIHSMEGPAEFVDVERRQGEQFAAAAGAAGGGRGGYLGGGVPPGRPPSPPPAPPPPGGEAAP